MDDLRGGTLALEHFYEVGDVLARDTLGTTYLGNQSPQDKPVAIWVLHKLVKMGASPDIVQRFKLAAWAASRINHPHHLALLDFGLLGSELPFVVFEHQPQAQVLRQHLHDHGPLSVQHTLDLIEQLASGLTRIHAEGFAHNALETSRVHILLHDDDTARIHATFAAPGIGLEREELLELEAAMITTDQIRHIPPEDFARSAPNVEPHLSFLDNTDDLPLGSRDVYGLAAIAYECLTGNHPYFKDLHDAADGILTMLHEQPLGLDHYDLPDSIDDVLQRALSRHPRERHNSAQAFAQAFRDAIPAELLDTPAGRKRTGRTTGSRSTHRPRGLRARLRDPVFRGVSLALVLLAVLCIAAFAMLSREPAPIIPVKPYVLPVAPAGTGVDVVIEARVSNEEYNPFNTPDEAPEIEIFRVFPDGETLLLGAAPIILRNQPIDERHRLVLTAKGMRSQQFEFAVKDQGGQLMMIERILNPDRALETAGRF